MAVYGGASITAQMKALKKAQHVIIATPGRLIDLIKRKAVNINQLRFLVLDEADEMLNMGFKDELDKILSYTPKQKTTWLFSATMPKEMNSIVSRYMNNPVKVAVNSENTVNANIEHQYAMVNNSDKVEALVRFLNTHPDMRGLVFCRTRRGTQKLADQLGKRNYKSDALHGDMSQNQRDKVMQKFKRHELQVLVATDVAARGIDVNDLSHVFHFSLPDDISYYTHRSGRTARAGKEGISISFISGKDRHMLNRISKDLDINFKKVDIPGAADVVDTRIESWTLDVLNTPYKGKLDEEVVDKVNMLFHNLSKEELIAKLISHQMEAINISGSTDLNQPDVMPDKKYKKSKRRSGGKSQHRKGRNPRNKKVKRKGITICLDQAFNVNLLKKQP